MMKRTHSNLRSYPLYEEELNNLTYTPTGLFEKFIHKVSRRVTPSMDLTYRITVPASDYLRGELFCDDVSEVINKPFTQKNLLSILIDDFLTREKQRRNSYDLFRELSSGIQQPIEIYHYRGEHETLHRKKDSQRNKEIDCTIKRKEALRLEVILSDLADLHPEITFTVNDVLQILYRNFIQQYKNGTLRNVVETIVKRLN